MRTETKVIQVANAPSEINAVNASQALWGWSVMSVQITDRKTVYDGDTTGYVDELGLHATTQRITETANYATITYSRDLDAPNTAELRRLEKEYENQTALAAMHSMSRTDEEYLQDWPEDLEWYQKYQRNKAEKGKSLINSFTFIPGVFTLLILLPQFMNSLKNTGDGETAILMLVMMVTVFLFAAVVSFRHFKRYREIMQFINDPQTPTRLESIRQHIEAAKAKDKANYDEAMSLRASLVKQAQALTGA